MKNFNIINPVKVKKTLTKRVLIKKNGKYVVVIEEPRIKVTFEKTEKGYRIKL